MARGRIITNEITSDKRINQLSDDTSRLAFTWLVTFADRDGRTYGDPGVVRSMLFPRREDVTIRAMEGYLMEWAQLGLIVWYQAKDDLWVYFPNFRKNQPGLSYGKEPASRIPAPEEGTPVAGSLPAVPRQPAGTLPEVRRETPSEEKRREENGREENIPPASADDGAGAPDGVDPDDDLELPDWPPPSLEGPQPVQEEPVPRRRRRDPRYDHPAILAIKEVSGQTPRKAGLDALIQAVGDQPDIPFLKQCCETWVNRGYNPTNFEGWVGKWYAQRSIPSQGPSGRQGSAAVSPVYAARDPAQPDPKQLAHAYLGMARMELYDHELPQEQYDIIQSRWDAQDYRGVIDAYQARQLIAPAAIDERAALDAILEGKADGLD